MPPPPASSKTEPDTDSTSELPSLQPAPQQGSGDHRQSSTDTWIVPPLAGARSAEAPPAPGAEPEPGDNAVQTLSSRLHETQGLLSAKDKRLRQIEHARDEALEACAGAGPR